MPQSGLTRDQLLTALEMLAKECCRSSDSRLRNDVSFLLLGIIAIIGIEDEMKFLMSMKPYVEMTMWRLKVQSDEHGGDVKLPPGFPKKPFA